MDHDLFSKRDLIGRLSFSVDEIRAAPSSCIEGWFILLDEEQGSKYNFAGCVRVCMCMAAYICVGVCVWGWVGVGVWVFCKCHQSSVQSLG
jgi:hypothetical protein